MGTPGVTTTSQDLKIFGMLFLVFVATLVCILGILSRLEQTKVGSTATPTNMLLRGNNPLVIIETSTVKSKSTPKNVSTPQATPFTVGEYWYPYRCTADRPSRCIFVQQGQNSGFWAECQEPDKYRPTYYQANPHVDWYKYEKDGILHPVNEKGNLQSFRFTSEEGQQK